jgi:hypothetical protein
MRRFQDGFLGMLMAISLLGCTEVGPQDGGGEDGADAGAPSQIPPGGGGGGGDGSGTGGGDSDDPLPTTGRLGDACTTPDDCLGGLCITRAGYPSYCSTGCTPGQADGGLMQCSIDYDGPAHPQCTVPLDTDGDGGTDTYGCEALCQDGAETWSCGAEETCQTFTINAVSYGACIPIAAASGGGGGGGAGDGGGGGAGDGGGGGAGDGDGDGGSAGGGQVSCQRNAGGAEYRVECSGPSGDVSCSCYLDDTLVETCAQSSLTCALPGGTCCSGF